MADTWFTQQETSKTAPNTLNEKSAGNRINPGPYIGIVKNVVDPLYSGVLQVYIPELGGDPTDKSSYKNMMYATPFYGRTNIQDGSSYAGSPHSYGMWFVPPDIDNKVLCIFANGDPAKGYWFACIPDWPSLHMVPAISAPVDGTSPAPVVDHYDNKENPSALENVRTLDRYIHEDQQAIWQKQGLLQDPDRGPMHSSAQRETPSGVFGISTPGRPILDDDPQLYPDNLGFTSGGSTSKSPGQLMGVMGRKGGHTFVMDDGDHKGDNQMFRLRSAAGHMILMNDTKEFIYIINSKGTSWIEMNAEGAINIYAESQMNITAKAGFNLETEKAIKMHGATVDILADNGLNISGKDINILGEGSTKLSGKQSLHLHSKKNSYLTGEACLQIKSDGHIDLKGTCHTINTADATKATEAGKASKPEKMPTHEPRTPTAGNPTASPTANTKNNSVGNPNNPYSGPNNFGSSDVPNNYNGQTNNNQPIVYNSGPQGSSQGQGSVYGSYAPDNYNGDGINWTVAGALAGAVAGYVFGGSGGYSVEGDSKPDYSVGELQNNPGNLPYVNGDNFAVGYNNNLAVYAKPEAGIAALSVVFDNLNSSTTTRCIDIIQAFLNAKSNLDPNVIEMTRYIHNNLGIVADDHVVFTDSTTRVGWIANVIKYLQGRIIYSYEQILTGCALGLGLDVNTFSAGIQPVTKPWQNNNGNNPFSGFVNPATNNSVRNNGASPLQVIGGALLGGFIGNLIDGSNRQTNQSTEQVAVVQVNDINAARRYLESNPDTASGTVFQYPDGSNFRLGGGSSTPSTYNGIFDNGTVFGNGQCAAIAQSTIPNFGTMASLQKGDAVLGNFNIPPGTVITTFNFKDSSGNAAYGPTNQPGGVSGYSHTAVLLGQGSDEKGQYIVVQDQWATSGGCGVRKIYSGGPEGADQFYIAKSAANGYDSAGVTVPGSENYSFVSNKQYIADGSPQPPPRPQDLNTTDVADQGRNFATTNNAYVLKSGEAYGDNTASSPITNNFTVPRGANPADIAGGGYGAPSQQYVYSTEQYVNQIDQTAKNNAEIEAQQDAIGFGLDLPDPVPSTVDFQPSMSNPVSSYYYFTNPDSNMGNGNQSLEIYRPSSSGAMQPIMYNNTPDRDQVYNFDAATTTSGGFKTNLDNNLGVVLPEENTPQILTSPDSTFAARPDFVSNNVAATPVQVQQESYYDPRTGEVKTVAVTTVAGRPDTITGQPNAPITGDKKAPGTGGTPGAQKTPGGANQTGAGGKSC